MARCPNCGRETLRTTDWCCQWCGYPLMSGSYKKAEKTYRELREERLPRRQVVEEEEPEEAPVAEVEPEPEPETELAMEAEPEPEAAPEPVEEPEPVARPKPRARRKTAAKAKSATATRSAAKSKSATKSRSTTRTRAAKKAEPVAEPETVPEPEAEPGPVMEPKTEAVTADMEITVSELLSEYEADGEAADEKFSNRVLRLTGVVDRVEVKENLGINYIILTAVDRNVLQGVRCNFSTQYGSEVSNLAVGQTVTVQGKYDGSIIDMNLRDCILIG